MLMDAARMHALMVTGQMACARTNPSSPDLVAWVGMAPLLNSEGDVSEVDLLALSFEAHKAHLGSGVDAVRELLGKRYAVIHNTGNMSSSLEQADKMLRTWNADSGNLNEAALDHEFPLWLVSVLSRTPRFGQGAYYPDLKISDHAYAVLFDGDTVCAEIAPSRDDLRAWVTIDPEHSYRVSENAKFRVYLFEAKASHIEAGYDLVGGLINERQADAEDGGFEQSLLKVQQILRAWGIDKPEFVRTKLAPDYPL